MPEPFVPPVYPYERLTEAKAKAEGHEGGAVDLSIGTPCDPPPAAAMAALAAADQSSAQAPLGSARGYPFSVGSAEFRAAAAGWMRRRFDVAVNPDTLGACVGTKEFVGTLPQWLRLRQPERDTVLYPAVAYPTYEMGAILAGCRAVPVRVDREWRLDLSTVAESDASRALALWVNSPGNPAGQLDDLEAAAAWGRARSIPVFSDECYAEFTWQGRPRTILEHGFDGVVAVHSLSKRSNLAGVRAGFYAGDGALVSYLSEVRKHVGLMIPGPVQAAAAAAYRDDAHVADQRARYERRLPLGRAILEAGGCEVDLPAGGFYLWGRAPGGDAWGYTERLAADGGALVSPGDIYGAAGAGWVRLAVVQPEERLRLVLRRLGHDG
jgi:succinyldiaminopimelate transaminase